MGTLDALLECEVVFEVDPMRVPITEARQRRRTLRDNGMRGDRHCDVQYRFRLSDPELPCFRRAARRTPAPASALRRWAGLDPEQLGPKRRVFAQPNGPRRQAEDVFAGARIQERTVDPCRLTRLPEMPFAYLAASEHDRQSSPEAVRCAVRHDNGRDRGGRRPEWQAAFGDTRPWLRTSRFASSTSSFCALDRRKTSCCRRSRSTSRSAATRARAS